MSASAFALTGIFTGSRGVGEFAVVGDLPDSLVAAFRVLTHLGDPWLLLAVLLLGYLFATHVDVNPARMAFVLALAFGALALTMGLKYAFSLPRPPGAVADGYGFPSGHALGATVVYGGLSALLPNPNRRRTAGFVLVIATVAVSRVVIGVHYLVDVLAGVAIGVLFLLLVLRTRFRRAPTSVTATDASHAFSVALLAGVAGVLLNLALSWPVLALSHDVAAGLGATAGGWLGWRLAGPTVVDLSPSRSDTVANVFLFPAVVVGLRSVSNRPLSLALYIGLMAVLIGILIALPVVTARLTGGVSK